MGAQVRRFVEPEAVAQLALEEVLAGLHRMKPRAGEDEVLRRIQRCVLSRVLQVVRKNKDHVGESRVPEVQQRELPSMGDVTRDDQRAWVRRLVEHLPEPYREVVQLCALEELSFVEAGRRLETSPDTIRKRYNRANELLRAAADRRSNG